MSGPFELAAQFGEEALGRVQVRAVARVLDGHLTVVPASGGPYLDPAGANTEVAPYR